MEKNKTTNSSANSTHGGGICCSALVHSSLAVKSDAASAVGIRQRSYPGKTNDRSRKRSKFE